MRLTAKYATNEADIQGMRRVRNTCTSFLTRDQRQITANEQRLWFRLLDRTKVWPFAFYQRGKVVGYGLIRREKDALWLSGGLLPSRRGQGLGRELFSFLVGYAIGIRADRLDSTRMPLKLEVFADNKAARKMYEKLGFEQTGGIANLPRANGKTFRPIYRMEFPL